MIGWGLAELRDVREFVEWSSVCLWVFVSVCECLRCVLLCLCIAGVIENCCVALTEVTKVTHDGQSQVTEVISIWVSFNGNYGINYGLKLWNYGVNYEWNYDDYHSQSNTIHAVYTVKPRPTINANVDYDWPRDHTMNTHHTIEQENQL
jgi:hypothetical protein